ncbi:hypothetical protein NUACC21_69340 [Scytonema sp. NUACC21]
MIQTLLLDLAIIFYLSMAYCFFNKWLDFFIADKEMSPEERFFSFTILVISTILWPVIVPFAYLEVLKFHQKHKEVIDSLLNSSKSLVQDD